MKHLITIMFLCLLVTSGSVQGRDHDKEADHSSAPKKPSSGYLDTTGVYVGEYYYGRWHGQGTLTFSDGRKYVGEFKYHGQGTMTFTSGGKYVGLWKANRMHGHGTFTGANGEKYVGEYRKGYAYGQGTYTFLDGGKYVGEWIDDKFHGQGTFTYGDRGGYIGFWMYPVDDIIKRFPYGTMYVGDWKNGKFDGQGTITFPDGSMYAGTFKDGEYHGHGIFTNADGRKFVGEFKDGAYLGQDTILFPAYYSFFGTLRPVSESIVIKIRPGHRWTCSNDTAMSFDGEPQEREILTVFMSTYRDDSGIKWYKEKLIEGLKVGLVIDVGHHGTEIKDLAGDDNSYLGKKLVEELLKSSKEQLKSPKEQLIELFTGSVGSLIGIPIQQDMLIRFAPNAYARAIVLGFDRNPLDITSLGTSLGKSVVLGETTVDSSRKLVLGLVINLDVKLSSLDGTKIDFKASVVGYEFVDLDSGLPTDYQAKITGFFRAKPQNIKAKIKIVNKQLCKR